MNRKMRVTSRYFCNESGCNVTITVSLPARRDGDFLWLIEEIVNGQLIFNEKLNPKWGVEDLSLRGYRCRQRIINGKDWPDLLAKKSQVIAEVKAGIINALEAYRSTPPEDVLDFDLTPYLTS